MLKSIFFIILSGAFILINADTNCDKIELQKNPKINITEYIRKSWYIQQQQINGYQSKNDLYCVVATYNIDNYSKVPFFNGTVLSVYNYANRNKVNGYSLNNSTVLCARQKNIAEPEKLLVAPCFLPNLFGGPYWILKAGPSSNNYEWAIVIGGQPSVRINNTCTTKEYGINNSGLWIFSRKKKLENEKLIYLRNYLLKNNISTS